MLDKENISEEGKADCQIMIVDDDLDFAASLKLILENEGYQPLLATVRKRHWKLQEIML